MLFVCHIQTNYERNQLLVVYYLLFVVIIFFCLKPQYTVLLQ